MSTNASKQARRAAASGNASAGKKTRGKHTACDYDDDDEHMDAQPSYDYEGEAEDDQDLEEYHVDRAQTVTVNDPIANIVEEEIARYRSELEQEAEAQLEHRVKAGPDGEEAERQQLLQQLRGLGFEGVEADSDLLRMPGVLERLDRFRLEASIAATASSDHSEESDDAGLTQELTTTEFTSPDDEAAVYKIPPEVWGIIIIFTRPTASIALASTCHWMRVCVEDSGFWSRLRKRGGKTICAEGRFHGPNLENKIVVPRFSVAAPETLGQLKNFNVNSTDLPSPKFPWSEFWSFWHYVWTQAAATVGFGIHAMANELEELKQAKMDAWAAADEVAIIAWLDLFRSAKNETDSEYARFEANRLAGMNHTALRLFDALDWQVVQKRCRRYGAPQTDAAREQLRRSLETATLWHSADNEVDIAEAGSIHEHLLAQEVNLDNTPGKASVGERYARNQPPTSRRYHVSSRGSTALSPAQERVLKQIKNVDHEYIEKHLRHPWYLNANERIMFHRGFRGKARDHVPFGVPDPNSWVFEDGKILYKKYRVGVTREKREQFGPLTDEEITTSLLPYNEQVARTAGGSK